jgi:DNA-binding NarL/FixJ family response regulator
MAVRILIADDNVAIRTELRRGLNTYDEWVICAEAENGQQAVSKAEEQRPDVIILDLDMPVMNGLQACQEIKQILPAVQVFIYTAYDSASVERAARKLGARAVIQKGWPIESLVAAVEQRLGN